MWKYLAILGCIVFVANVHSAPQAPQAPAEKPQPVTRKGLFFFVDIVVVFTKQIIFIALLVSLVFELKL